MGEGRGVVVAVDQGTSSTKAIAVAPDGHVVARTSVAVAASHPRPGWVEQDPHEILASATTALRALRAELHDPVIAVGLSTQRESALVWDRSTGEPLGPLLGWQDRRTADAARRLGAVRGDDVRRRTGLPLDPMFSALKLAWLLDDVDPDRSLSRAGKIAVGTVDAYLLDRLTGEHRIEVGNASRTQLLDIATGEWDAELLDLFEIPADTLPRVTASVMDVPVTATATDLAGVPITAVLGDSHAALYGHGADRPGTVKVTYGTGSSVMGIRPSDSGAVDPGLGTTIAWDVGAGPVLAFEGNILATGATLVWLGELLGEPVADLFARAATVETLHGVDLVPAFAGLGAPWWSESAEASLSGFTLGTARDTVARAAVDSVVLQVEDVLDAAERSGIVIDTVHVDGAPSANSWLVQLQSDLSQRHVRRSGAPDLSAWGAAALAFRGATGSELPTVESGVGDRFDPLMDQAIARARRRSWRRSVARVVESARHTTNEEDERNPA